MGCIDSRPALAPRTPNAAPVQNYNNNPSTMFYQMQNAKRPKFLNPQQLGQPQKQILWSIIQKNSLKQFAYYIQSQRIPSNMQIGPANTFWNFAHFCCRWDAFECLLYIAKRVFAQNRTLILSLNNQQTIQGFTALHIAIQYNSINCFYALLDCGGVDMSYKDHANNDVFAKANLFKRPQMLQVLQKFKAGDALMVLVQPQTLRGFQDFNQMVASGQVQSRKQYKLTSQRIDYIVDSKNRLNRPPPPPPPPQNNNKYQDYQKAMKQIQSKKNNTSTQMTQGADFEDVYKKKLQQQLRFQQEEARIKKQKADELKRRIQAQKQLQEKRLREETEKQINKERVYEQAQLEKIERQKQIIRKNIQAMQSNVQGQINVGKGTKMVCPEDIRVRYEAALAKRTKFVDEEFPASNKSLGKIQEFKFGWSDCVWLRPQQIFPGGKFQVFDGISPDDVKQGTLAVCYYLALLSAVAEHEDRIKKIFRFYDKDLGFYAIQLYLQGRPITMVVDDQIPCLKGTNQPLFSKPNGAEVWVMIFEKAWVKLFGNYLSAQKMSPSDMFENVLPAPCTVNIIDISKIDEAFDKLIEYDKKKYIMTASTIKGVQIPPGIVEEHAYSLIGAYNINGVRICKLRNPWGKTEYSGMYSENSTLWTPQMKKAVGFKTGDDGQFYLTPTQLHQLMPYISISLFRDNYEYSYTDINSKSNQYLYYIVNIKKKGEIAVKVTQQNQRFSPDMEYENAPIRFQIIKLGQNYDAKIFSEGEDSIMYGGATNLYSKFEIYQDFQPGRYMIRLKIMYDCAHSIKTRGTLRKFIRGTDGKNNLVIRQGKSVLSMYGPQSYVFNKISQQQGTKYMRNVYKNFILAKKQPSQRLRAVGQDLKPLVLALDCKMRNQIIYMAQNLMPNNSINFCFRFNHKIFRNCSYAYNVDKQKQCCEWVIEPGGWNLLTLEIDCPFQEVATQHELKTDYKIVR